MIIILLHLLLESKGLEMPSSKNLSNLIKYIITEVQDSGGLVLRTRLVKLLYLCDIEYFRNYRKLITGLDWIRYKYGPFAFELIDIGGRMGIDIVEESVDFSSGKGFRVTVEEPPDPDKWFEYSQRLVVDRVIKRWGDEDLNLMLDYVYCDTEPMKNAQYQEKLDFNKVIRGMRRAGSTSLDLSSDDKKVVKQLVEKTGTISRKPISFRLSKPKNETVRDETPSPPIKGTIEFNDKNTIKMFEGRE